MINHFKIGGLQTRETAMEGKASFPNLSYM